MRIAALLVFLSLAVIQSGNWLSATDEKEDEKATTEEKSSAEEKPSPEELAVRKNAEAFVKAFNKADAKSVAALFAPTGQMSVDGEPVAVGREEIETTYTKFFKENPGKKIRVTIDSIRVVGPNLAVERGTSQVTSEDSDVLDVYTVVHVRKDGQWFTATADVKQEPIAWEYDWKEELGVLVGNWVATKEDWRVESTIEWVANDAFLRRNFKVINAGKVESSGVQVIGWDAREGTITSWDFGADGGHARGWWTRDGEQWVIESEGTTPYGELVQATNVITLLGKDAFRWQSTKRSVENVPLDDTDSILVRRVTK